MVLVRRGWRIMGSEIVYGSERMNGSDGDVDTLETGASPGREVV